DLFRVDLRFLERALRGDDAEIGGRGVAERAAIRPEGRARAVNDDDVFHGWLPSGEAASIHCPTRWAEGGRRIVRPPSIKALRAPGKGLLPNLATRGSP